MNDVYIQVTQGLSERLRETDICSRSTVHKPSNHSTVTKKIRPCCVDMTSILCCLLIDFVNKYRGQLTNLSSFNDTFNLISVREKLWQNGFVNDVYSQVTQGLSERL